MKPDSVKDRLLPYEAELKLSGIASLSIFGSVARGQATSRSDVDLLSDFDKSRTLTAFEKAGLESRLSEILNAPVELCDRRLLHDDIRIRVEREAVFVF